MKQVNIDISDKIVSGVLSNINRKRIYIRTADWDTVMSRFDEYANTSLYQSCIKLYNGADLDIPELPEQDYFALATAKQEVESRKRFLANRDYNLACLTAKND